MRFRWYPGPIARLFAEDMRAADADWQLHVFGGVGHSYTNESIGGHNFPGFEYHPLADRRSWELMKSLLAEVFS